MRALLDVNVLIALHDRDHVHHTLAAQWLHQHARNGWASCPLTQDGCLRIMSQPGYPNAQPLASLIAMLGRSTAAPFHQFWPEDVSILDSMRFHHAHLHGHRQVSDIYLLGLAIKNHGRLVTFDQRIPLSAVLGATAAHLIILG